MVNRVGKAKQRRAEISMRKVQAEFPDFDPLVTLARIANNQHFRIDPLTGLPIRIPVEVSDQLSATKEIASYLMPKLKAIEISMDSETIARQQVLAQVPLATLVATLQADSRVGIEQGGDVIEHDPLDALDNIPAKPKTS